MVVVVVVQEAGLSVEDATLLGERNSLLHYACKLERTQREQAEDSVRREKTSRTMVRLYSVLEGAYQRTLSRRFTYWRNITLATVTMVSHWQPPGHGVVPFPLWSRVVSCRHAYVVGQWPLGVCGVTITAVGDGCKGVGRGHGYDHGQR